MKYFERQKLTYVDYYKCSLIYYYDALMLGSITIAYIVMTIVIDVSADRNVLKNNF